MNLECKNGRARGAVWGIYVTARREAVASPFCRASPCLSTCSTTYISPLRFLTQLSRVNSSPLFQSMLPSAGIPQGFLLPFGEPRRALGSPICLGDVKAAHSPRSKRMLTAGSAHCLRGTCKCYWPPVDFVQFVIRLSRRRCVRTSHGLPIP